MTTYRIGSPKGGYVEIAVDWRDEDVEHLLDTFRQQHDPLGRLRFEVLLNRELDNWGKCNQVLSGGFFLNPGFE